MRVSLYRGLNMKGKWIFGSLVTTTMGNTKTWIVQSARGNGGWFNVIRREYVKPETVGQFTGIHDKNNIRIYEGDNAKFENSFSKSPFVGRIRYYADCKPIIDDGKRSVDIAETNSEDLEVTGNIYETNKEESQ